MGAYIKNLPSTPQMERYTAAPSAYTDPTVQASPPAWWGSSLGGCGSCGLGVDSPLGFLTDRRFVLAAVGATIGYLAAPKAKHGLYVAGGFFGGLLLARFGLATS